ncbi:MAG: methylenetetrahydrofolate reductase [bacterium]|nr:methylenetetrahydrofolate reductase [bacterium]
MSTQATGLQERISSGKTILLAEIHPPPGVDPAPLRTAAKLYAGKIHAVGVSDNRDRVAMSALAAASLLKAEGLEPILHVTTRDRNRIALVSEALGAQALGIRNLLCTSGTHQTLGRYRAARNVYDIDAVQLLQACANLAGDGGLLGESGFEGAGPFCLGAVASPDADPPDLQLMRLAKKMRAGAKFLVTQPVFDPERFEAWWETVARRGLNGQVAILAGIRPLSDADLAPAPAGPRQSPGIPDALAARVASLGDPGARRDASVEIALETIRRLSNLPGIRGFCISADGDHEAVLRIIEESGLAGD